MAANIPVVIYDGDCGFCTRTVNRLRAWLPVPVDAIAWQFADLERHGVTEAQCRRAVQWLAPDGRRATGHAAFARWLIAAERGWRPVGWLLLTPPVSWLAAVGYRLIAANRHRIPSRSGGSCPVPERR